MRRPSGAQAGLLPLARTRRFAPSTPTTSTDGLGDAIGALVKASHCPAGDQLAEPSLRSSGVKSRNSLPSARTSHRSWSFGPVASATNANHVESGDHSAAKLLRPSVGPVDGALGEAPAAPATISPATRIGRRVRPTIARQT